MRYRVFTAFFQARAELDEAISRLLAGGVSADAISLLPKDVVHLDDIGLKAASKASEGASLGALTGGVLGATFAALAAAGSLIIPDVGAVIAGPLVSALAGAGAGGAIGLFLGALIGACVPEYEAAYLDDALRMGGALLAVRCFEERADTIEAILAESGGRRIFKSSSRVSLEQHG